MLLLIEALAIVLLIGLQVRAFLGARAQIGRLENLFPGAPALFLAKVSDPASGREVDTVASTAPSPEFGEVLATTNVYLLKNKGTADFNILQDLTERRVAVLDGEIQSTTSLPLYIGLMGTFGGAILGLVSLVLGDGRFDDAAIAGFLRGIMVAMVGSLCGLGLTLWGNALYRTARRQAERLRNDYYSFLQVELLPILHSDMAGSLGTLKTVLDGFNVKFVNDIQSIGPAFEQLRPLIDQIISSTEVQRRFLERLQGIGFTEMANASVAVFDRMDRSAHLFEDFLVYQEKLNATLAAGGEVVRKVEGLLSRLTGLETGLNQVPAMLQQHNETVDRQFRFFNQSQERMDRMGADTEQYFDKAARQLTGMMSTRLAHFNADAENAQAEWQRRFDALKADNIYQRIVEYLNPFSQLPAQQQALNQLQERQAQQTGQAIQGLQQRLDADLALQQQLLFQVARTNAVLEQLTERSWLQKALGLNKK